MKILINDNLMTAKQIEEVIDLLFDKKDNRVLEIEAVKTLTNSSIYKDGKLYIEYINKSYIFKSIFNYASEQNYNKKITECLAFKDLTVMLDCSRNGVLTLDFVKKIIRYLALMGYTSLQLYTEDTYEIEEEPYFGYLRGRYSKKDLKMLDQYAFEYGIELIPCIQTLAHLKTIFKWPEYFEIQDIDDILLVGEERTYILIENMFKTINECFRSKQVNIGMDEAFMLGLGKYFTKHGISNRMSLMLEHLCIVSKIASKYNYKCSMWSDMFYRLAFGGYYSEEYALIDKNVVEKIPDNIELIYWDYYSDKMEHLEKIISQHKVFEKNIWLAAGGWTFLGFLPDNDFSIRAVKASVSACKNQNVKSYLMTLWGDNGNECPKLVTLPVLLYLSEYAYGNTDDKLIESKFKRLTNLPIEAFLISEKIDKVGNVTNLEFTDPSKYLLYNDCLCGYYDTSVSIDDGHEYKKIAKELSEYCGNKEFGYIFDCHRALALVMEKKVTIGIKTRKYYQENNLNKLAKLVKHDYKVLISRLELFYAKFSNLWIKENKTFGFEIHDYRIGGLIRRVKYCQELIKRYCEGKLDRIEELEIVLLDAFGNYENYTKQLGYINTFDKIFTVNNF